MSKKKQRVQIGQVWKHCKTSNMYLIEKFTTDEATEKTMVIYKPLKDNRHWNRTLESFLTPGRFEFMYDGIVEAKLPGNLEDKLQITQLQDSNKSLSHEVELQAKRIREIVGILSARNTRIKELHIEKQNQVDFMSKLSAENVALKEKLLNQQVLKNTIEFTRDSLKTARDQVQELAEKLEESNKRLTVEVEELRKECRIKENLMFGQGVKFQELESSANLTISALNHTCGELKEKVKQLEVLQLKCRGNSNYYSEIKEKEIAELKSEIARLWSVLSDIQTKYFNLCNHRDILVKKVQELESMISSDSNLTEQLKRQEQVVYKLERSLQIETQNAAELKSTIERLKIDGNNLRNRLKGIQQFVGRSE